MSTADIAIIATAAGVCYLATVGAAAAVVFKLARQLRVAAPPKQPPADDQGAKS